MATTGIQVIETFLSLIPRCLKPVMFRIAVRFGRRLYHNIIRIPFNLVLKVYSRMSLNEAHALQFVNSIHSVHAPHLLDYAADTERVYTLMTWIDGECIADIWDELTATDKDRIVVELRTQLRAMHNQTTSRQRTIAFASGQPIWDPRVPWVAEEPQIFHTCQDFFRQVWLGLEFPRFKDTLRPAILPLVQREDVPIVFCHAEILPKNLILPGGLKEWREGSSPLRIIDWEYAGWMPLPWEALKATWMCFDRDEDEWYRMMREVFDESAAELEADWLWRTKSGIPIV